MVPSAKRYRKEYAFELLKIAAGDLDSAKVLASVKQGRPENAIYLTQQSIEKSLKAVRCFLEQKIVHTHDIEVLVQALPEDNLPPDAYSLGLLTQYATIRRYEEGYEEISEADLKAVISLGDKVLIWANLIIKKEDQKLP